MTKDTLAGRIIELSLYPLSAKERNHKATQNVVDMLFERDFSCEKIDTRDK